MTDPLAQVVELLGPRAVFSKAISGAGAWAVRYAEFGLPGFCAVLEGRCRLAVDGEDEVILEAGDFVLLPATPAFTIASIAPAEPVHVDPKRVAGPAGEVRHGRRHGPPEMRLLGGHFVFAAPDIHLLVSLLPALIHIRGVARLAALVALVREETGDDRPGRDLVLARLVELLLIEALRASPGRNAPPGLLRGLADARIAAALRKIHAAPERAWTVAALAAEARLSRSAFFDRFERKVGLQPMTYLRAWRMAVAGDLLRRDAAALDDVARRVGYGSASTFSTAFSRHAGMAPRAYARKAGSRAA